MEIINYQSIKSYLEENSNSNIQQRVKSIAMPLAIVIVSLAVIIVAATPVIPGAYLSLAFIVVALTTLIIGLTKLAGSRGPNKYEYVYTPTNEVMKEKTVYVDEATMRTLKSCVKSKDFSALADAKPALQSTHCLDFFGGKQGEFYVVQLLHYENYNYVPESEIMLISGEGAKWLKEFSTK